MDKTKIWMLAGAIVMVGVLAMGWFVGVQPQLTSIADTDSQTESIRAQNQATEIANAKLKGDYENIDEFRAELEKLRGSIPADAAMPTFLTQIDALASSTGTVIAGITVDEPQPYTAPASSAEAPAAPAAEATDDSAEGAETASENSDAEAQTEEEDTAPVISTDPRITAENFVAVPVSIDVRGTFAQAMEFTSALQHGTRLYLVTELSTSESPETATDIMQVEAHVSGYVYVLLTP